MKLPIKLRKQTVRCTLLAIGLLWSIGCGSPPSVTPLLRMADRAMQDEVARMDDDLERDLYQLGQTRQALATAFDADLAQQEQLTAQWVREGMDVYVAAREALTRQEMQLRRQRQQRQDNLRAAAQAVRRASRLLEQQDKLIEQTVGFDVWRLDQNNAQP